MKRFFGLGALAIGTVAFPAMAQTGGAVEVGDIAFGLSVSDALATAEQVRGGAMAGRWTAQPWAQSMEFDNLCGPFSHGGNLLGLNWGGSSGGQLYNYATDGTDVGEAFYAFDGSDPNITQTPASGLGVSPDNTRLSVFGYGPGTLIILDYVASDGTGAGAQITGAKEYQFAGIPGTTQGTTWLDNDNVLVAAQGFAAGTAEIKKINADTGAESIVAVVTVRGGASVYTDIEYNPNISPFVYVSYSAFDGGTMNTLAVLDPTNWSEVKNISLDGSCQTLREIGLGADGLLYIGQYGGSAAVGPWIDTISGNPGLMSDDGSIDYYQSPVQSSHNGLDVCVQTCGSSSLNLAASGSCPGSVTFDVTGATPNGNLALVYGFGDGPTTIPQGRPCAGTVLDLGNPRLDFRTLRANANGEASLTANVPGSACGRVRVQIVDLTSCDTSNKIIVN